MLASTSGLSSLLSVSTDARRSDIIVMGMGVIGALGCLIERTAFGGIDRLTLARWGIRESA